MIEIINYIIIGAIQGIFEWLPISSQGNIVILLTNVFNIPSSLAFDYSIFLHIGTVFSAIVYFRKDIYKLLNINTISSLFKKSIRNYEYRKDSNLLKFLIISVFFSFLISFPLYLFIKSNIDSINLSILTLIIAILLIFTGILSLVRKKHENKFQSQNISRKINPRVASFLGIIQSLSIFPGISRSGITTSYLLVEKFTPYQAFRLSFLLSIPTILIAEIGLLFFNNIIFNPLILVSLVSAFIIGYITIGALINFSKKINFSSFCFILAFIYIILFFV